MRPFWGGKATYALVLTAGAWQPWNTPYEVLVGTRKLTKQAEQSSTGEKIFLQFNPSPSSLTSSSAAEGRLQMPLRSRNQETNPPMGLGLSRQSTVVIKQKQLWLT